MSDGEHMDAATEAAREEAAMGDADSGEAAMSERPAWQRLLGLLAGDVAIGVLLGVMIVVTLLFSSGASKFVYIDF